MAKILIATEKPFSKVAVDGIKKVADEAGMELALLEKYTEKAQLLEAVADTDALIVRSDKVDAEVVEAAKNLKIVVRAGAGFDNLDLEACTKAGVVAMNTPGQNANSVAELVFGMLVMAVRNFYDGSVHLSVLHHGSADLGVLAVDDGQHAVEHHGLTSLGLQLLDKQSVALGDDVLLTTGHDNSLHFLLHLPFLHYGLAVGGGQIFGIFPSLTLCTHSKRPFKYNSEMWVCQGVFRVDLQFFNRICRGG